MSEEVLHGLEYSDPPTPVWMGEARTRARTLSSCVVEGDFYYQIYGPPQTSRARFYATGLEVTHDMVRREWKRIKGNPVLKNMDLGGPFDSRTVYYEPSFTEAPMLRNKVGSSDPMESYSGALFAHDNVRELARYMDNPKRGPVLPPPYGNVSVAVDPLQLAAMGATAIARTTPTAPNVSVAQTLGELREGLPNLSLKALRAGNPGSEYLNSQFGILPTVADFRAYRETAKKSEEILDQWYRDSGRRVKRRYTFPDNGPEVTTETGSGLLQGTHGGFPWTVDGASTCTVTKTVSRRVWFEGEYRYFMPPQANTFLRKLKEYNRLFGVIPTPKTAWELTPFSWLLDWGGNFGDVITNVSQLGQDGLVLTYGYVMCHSKVTYDYVWKGRVYVGNIPTPTQVTNRVVIDVKQRQGANPYGLGWTTSELTPKQLSILAALGISYRR